MNIGKAAKMLSMSITTLHQWEPGGQAGGRAHGRRAPPLYEPWQTHHWHRRPERMRHAEQSTSGMIH